MDYHIPVMAGECIKGLEIKDDGIYVDATYGGGGHSRLILNRLGEKGKLFAFDQDEDAHRNKVNDNRLILIRDNFRNMEHQLRNQGINSVNGILADLGVSSHQFDTPERGFTFRFDHNLDMRMDNRSGLTALSILNSYSEKELVRIFSAYGEVRNSKTLALEIVNARKLNPFTDSASFITAISHLIPQQNRNTYLAQVYQALRIEVNGEMEALRELMQQSGRMLCIGGRLVVLSYHSLEDRLVKNFFSKGNFEGADTKDIYGNPVGRPFRQLTRKPLVPDEEEIQLNPRSRSAKLRIAEKT